MTQALAAEWLQWAKENGKVLRGYPDEMSPQAEGFAEYWETRTGHPALTTREIALEAWIVSRSEAKQ